MTILNVGNKIRCIAHYSTSTTRGSVYEIGRVDGGSTTDGRITYHYVDDDADDDNMDTISHDSLSSYFEVVTSSPVIKLAFVGKMRSGKDTVATRLVTQYGFQSFAFGTALKASAHDIFPDVPRTPKPRALYQFMNVMREYDEGVWIKHVERSVEYALDRKTTQGIVITDARQANEIDWARRNGFTIVRVVAPESARIARAQAVGDVFDYEALSHPTETEVDGFNVDAEIVNDGDYAELVRKVDGLIEEIRKGASV